MDRPKELKNLVQTFDKGANTVEEVHQAIARMPIDVLERISPNLPFAKTVADVQKKIIGTIYDMIRVVSGTVCQIAEDVIRTGEKPAKKAAPRTHPSKHS